MYKAYSIISNSCLGTNIQDQSMKLLWIELYALAHFSDNGSLRRGQVQTTYKELTERTGLTLKQVRTRVESLVESRFLAKESTNQGLIITILGYDKQMRGKGRRLRSVKRGESKRYDALSIHEGRPMADNGANVKTCISMTDSNKAAFEGMSHGRQNEGNDSPFISKREIEDVVVEENSNNNPSISVTDMKWLYEKKRAFKDDVLRYIDNHGLRQNLEDISFREAIRKFLEYYGAIKDEHTLVYETINGFTIDCKLNRWLRNEHSLNNQ